MDIHEKITALETRTGANRPPQVLRDLMERYIPQALSLPAIQVAGTNGKGSTITWLSLLAGRPVIGTFTSPHLFSHTERICINGRPIPETDWERIYDQWLPVFDQHALTMFEIDLWMALVWFHENGVDLALMEVGLGGGRDATTSLDYLSVGITNIGWDHMQFLGETLEEIAAAKAGIFKPGVPAATSETALFSLLERLACDAGTRLHRAPAVSLGDKYPRWQQDNLGLAITLLKLAGIPMRPVSLAIRQFSWPGRFQVLQPEPLQVLDGAHNLPGIQALVQSLPPVERIYFSVLADKEAPKMIECLLETGKPVILVHFDSPRLADLESLASRYGLPIVSLQAAQEEKGAALYCGSLKFAGALLAARGLDHAG